MEQAKKLQVEKLQVITLGEGRWAVSSSSGAGTYELEMVGETLSCNCPAGLSGKWCKHKNAVQQVAELNGIHKEKQLEGLVNGDKKPKLAKDELARRTVNGYDFGEVTSAVQKAIRRSNEREAVYWALELYKTAPHYLIKRLLVIASEDVGMADPLTVGVVNNLAVGWAEAKKFSWYVTAHQPMMMVMLLCRAPKSTEVEDLIAVTELDVKEGRKRKIPLEAIDMHTSTGKARDKAAGKTYDDQCRDWYQGRLKAGIQMNKYTTELEARRPVWFADPHLPEFFKKEG